MRASVCGRSVLCAMWLWGCGSQMNARMDDSAEPTAAPAVPPIDAGLDSDTDTDAGDVARDDAGERDGGTASCMGRPSPSCTGAKGMLTSVSNLKPQSGKTYTNLRITGMVNIKNISNVKFVNCVFDADGDTYAVN